MHRKAGLTLSSSTGDTTTTGAAALAAYYLRSWWRTLRRVSALGDSSTPFPEEVMRKIADTHKRPSFRSNRERKGKSLAEGYDPGLIWTEYSRRLALMMVRKGYRFKEERLNEIDFESQRNILVEVHRRENSGKGWRTWEKRSPGLPPSAQTYGLVSVHRNPKARSSFWAPQGRPEDCPSTRSTTRITLTP